jgi:hypothetical protein
MEVSGQLHSPAALLQGKEPLGTHWIEGWVSPRAGLDAVERGKSLDLIGNRTFFFFSLCFYYVSSSCWLHSPISMLKVKVKFSLGA